MDDTDRASVLALIAAYPDRIDGGDFNGVGGLFEHGTWNSRRGRDESRDYLHRNMILYADGTPRTRHFVGNLALQPIDDVTIEARSSIVLLQQVDPREPIVPAAVLDYHDRFVRGDDGWRYQHRDVTPLLTDFTRHLRQPPPSPTGLPGSPEVTGAAPDSAPRSDRRLLVSQDGLGVMYEQVEPDVPIRVAHIEPRSADVPGGVEGLLASYARLLDDGDVPAAAALFSGGRCNGLGASVMSERLERIGARLSGIHRMVGNVQWDAVADGTRMRSVLVLLDSDQRIVGVDDCLDYFALVDGVWRWDERITVPRLIDPSLGPMVW